MRAIRVYKKSRKTTVQLTSLLDLLFVMIFVSLIQQKNIPVKVKEQTQAKATPKVETPTKKPTPKPRPVHHIVKATFTFSGSAMHGSVGGSYMMHGSFNEKTRQLNLGGISWIQRPAGYDMVPLSGKIDETNSIFKGRVDAPNCQSFNLHRIEKVSGPPIAGKWKGTYTCGQGQTGLTLTVQ